MNKPMNFALTTPTPQQITAMLEDWPMRITKNHKPMLNALNAISIWDTITIIVTTAKDVLFSLTRIPAATIVINNDKTGREERAYVLVHVNNREKLSPYRRQHDKALSDFMPHVDQAIKLALTLPEKSGRSYHIKGLHALSHIPSPEQYEKVAKAVRGFVLNQITENNNMITDGVQVRPTAIYRYPGTSSNVVNIIRNTGLLMSIYPEELTDLFDNTYPGALLNQPDHMTGSLVLGEKTYKFVMVHAFGVLSTNLRANKMDDIQRRRLAYSLSRIVESEFPILFANQEALHKMRASIVFD